MAEKGPGESVLNFIENQQKRIEDKKRQKEEAAAAAAKAEEERARIQREKTVAFIRKYWKVLLAAVVALALVIAIGAWSEADDKAEGNTVAIDSSSSALEGQNYEDVVTQLREAGFTNVKTEAVEDLVLGLITEDGEVEEVEIGGDTDYESGTQFSKDAEVVVRYHTFPKTEEPAAKDATDPTEQEPADQALESTFPVENAKRAAVVALTNANAVDVFASDGNSYDVSKFHSYADTSGNVDDYFWNVSSWGTWSAKDEQTWHVDSLRLEHSWGAPIDASLDVKFDGAEFIVSNLTGIRGDADHATELYVEDGPYLSVPAKLIKDDRKQAEVDALDHSGDLDKYAARTAFEKYGKSAFPYGFKCAWTLGLIAEEQRSDGSWYFKVDVKITNQYGAKRDAVAEGVVSGTTATPIVGDFHAN